MDEAEVRSNIIGPIGDTGDVPSSRAEFDRRGWRYQSLCTECHELQDRLEASWRV